MPSLKAIVLVALATAQAAHGQTISLGSAQTFGTIAGAQLTNAGSTYVTGNIGTWPGTVILGYPPGLHSGSYNPATPLAQNAQKYCTAAYKKALTLVPTVTLPPNLSSLTLPPGIYKFSAANVVLNTVLTLNGASNPNGQWKFIITGTFTTSPGSAIQHINGAQSCNTYFIVQNSASIGSSTRFQGNILAYDTIKADQYASNLSGTFCTIKGPIITNVNKLQAYAPVCIF
jgi:hypothetical protein